MSTDSLQLLNSIASSQETTDPDRGLFLSDRYHQYFPIRRTDNNLFFTSSILLILDLISDRLNSDEKSVVESIRSNALPAFESFCKKGDTEHYNFWKTGKNKHFPGTVILNKLKFFQLPFDLDSSSVTYMVQQRSSSEVKALQQKMVSHANVIKGRNKTSLKKYQDLPLYSSWFGEKMPIEIDLCVICNILTLILSSNVELNDCDHACIELIESVITEAEYFDHAFVLSPAYPNPIVILYHLSRLFSVSESTFNSTSKEKLIRDLQQVKSITMLPFEKILIENSIAKLTRKNISRDENLLNSVKGIRYPWFTAGFLSAFSSTLLKKLAPSPIFHMKFNCVSFNNTVVFEYLKLSE